MSYVKLVVIHQGDSVYGYTYDEGPGYCQATFAGAYKSNKKVLRGKGMQMLRNSGTHGLAVYKLNYSKEGNTEYLSGAVGMKDGLSLLLTFGMGSPLYLKKESNAVDTIAYMRQKLKAVPVEKITGNQPAVVPRPDTSVKKEAVPPTPVIKDAVTDITEKKQQRVSKVVQTIYTNADTVKMYVYDNGEVDGDTVTVFFDNTVILDRYRISAQAKELSLPVQKGQSHSIDLFANNLGTIPPNTALVIIMAGNRRYELRTSYDLETNARIIIQYKE